MIRAKVYKNTSKDVYAFEIKNHTDSNVCAAVSALSQNAINSIEVFTDQKFSYNINEKGFLSFKCLTKNIEPSAALLLNSFLLGLQGIAESYPEKIYLKIKE